MMRLIVGIVIAAALGAGQYLYWAKHHLWWMIGLSVAGVAVLLLTPWRSGSPAAGDRAPFPEAEPSRASRGRRGPASRRSQAWAPEAIEVPAPRVANPRTLQIVTLVMSAVLLAGASGAVGAFVGEAAKMGVLNAGHFVDNPASGRVLRKVGFAYTGETERMFSMGRGESVDCKRMRFGGAPANDDQREFVFA